MLDMFLWVRHISPSLFPSLYLCLQCQTQEEGRRPSCTMRLLNQSFFFFFPFSFTSFCNGWMNKPRVFMGLMLQGNHWTEFGCPFNQPISVIPNKAKWRKWGLKKKKCIKKALRWKVDLKGKCSYLAFVFSKYKVKHSENNFSYKVRKKTVFSLIAFEWIHQTAIQLNFGHFAKVSYRNSIAGFGLITVACGALQANRKPECFCNEKYRFIYFECWLRSPVTNEVWTTLSFSSIPLLYCVIRWKKMEKCFTICTEFTLSVDIKGLVTW